MYPSTVEISMVVPQNLKIEYHVIQLYLLAVHPKELKAACNRDTCKSFFLCVELFITAKSWNQP
jgi:hypothetical protein